MNQESTHKHNPDYEYNSLTCFPQGLQYKQDDFHINFSLRTHIVFTAKQGIDLRQGKTIPVSPEWQARHPRSSRPLR